MDKPKDAMNKRVRRHTWTQSSEQELKPSKKVRHFSAPNAGPSSEADLLGSILSGMKSPKVEASKWEGQPNYSELRKKKQETKWDHKPVHEKPHNQWWSTDPLQLESSSKTMMSKSSKSNNSLPKSLTAEQLKPFQKFRKAQKSDSRNIERKKLQAKARSLDLNSNKDKKLAKGIDVEREPLKYSASKSKYKKNDERSHDKREKDGRPQVKEKIKKNNSKKENASGRVNFGNKKEMEGTKPWRSKSSWKGAGKLGSTRNAWRPDRAYDFGRNHMEINDVETPNDDFELARIV